MHTIEVLLIIGRCRLILPNRYLAVAKQHFDQSVIDEIFLSERLLILSLAKLKLSKKCLISNEMRNRTGLVIGEIRSLWSDGLLEYISDLWNIVDFIQNTFYVIWISMRVTAWWIVQVRFITLLQDWILKILGTS